MIVLSLALLLGMSEFGAGDFGDAVFPKISKGLGTTLYRDVLDSHTDIYVFGNLSRPRRQMPLQPSQLKAHVLPAAAATHQRHRRSAPNKRASGQLAAGRPTSARRSSAKTRAAQFAPMKLVTLNANGSVASTGDNQLTGQLVAADPAGNVAAGMAELQLPGVGVTGPVYELVGAGVKLQQASPPPPPVRPKNASAVGEVTVNIQHTNNEKKKVLPPRHWCDLSGVWINDEGSLLLTLGFPSADPTLVTGYLSQVSVDMTPHGQAERRRRRRRRRSSSGGAAGTARRRRRRTRRRRRRGILDGGEPYFPPPAAGTSGVPTSLTNRTVLQGSAVSRAGPFTVVTRHGGGAVGSMVGQCQLCGGLDTIVAQFISVSEVFNCIDALWSQKSVHFMFRKWGERHRPRHHHRPQLLETEVVIKQHDKSKPPPPRLPPPPPRPAKIQFQEELVETLVP